MNYPKHYRIYRLFEPNVCKGNLHKTLKMSIFLQLPKSYNSVYGIISLENLKNIWITRCIFLYLGVFSTCALADLDAEMGRATRWKKVISLQHNYLNMQINLTKITKIFCKRVGIILFKRRQVKTSTSWQCLQLSLLIVITSSKGCNNYHKGLRHGTSTHDLVHPIVKPTEDQPFTVSNQEVSDPEPKELEQKEDSDPEPKELEQEIKKVKEKLAILEKKIKGLESSGGSVQVIREQECKYCKYIDISLMKESLEPQTYAQEEIHKLLTARLYTPRRFKHVECSEQEKQKREKVKIQRQQERQQELEAEYEEMMEKMRREMQEQKNGGAIVGLIDKGRVGHNTL